jgi:hypothetical protein
MHMTHETKISVSTTSSKQASKKRPHKKFVANKTLHTPPETIHVPRNNMIAAAIIAATISVLEFFAALAKKVVVHLLLQGRQMLSQLRRPQQPVVVDEHPAPPRQVGQPQQLVVVDEHRAPLRQRHVTWRDCRISRRSPALQPHTRGESASRSAFLLVNSERNKLFFAKHVSKMRLVLSQISGLTTQVSQTPIDSSRRQYYRNLCRQVPHNYVIESKAHGALEELTRLWNQLKQQHPHRLSEYQQVFDECVLYEQGSDIIFLEMRLRAEFAAPPALESHVVPPQAVANPPAPEEEDHGVVDMEVEPIEEPVTDNLVVGEEVDGVVDMEVEPIEGNREECKQSQDLQAWIRTFNSIPIVSTPPAPAPAVVEKVEEVVDVKVQDPIIGMLICFQPTATQVTVAVSHVNILLISFLHIFSLGHLTPHCNSPTSSQTPVVEEVATRPSNEEEVAKRTTRKRSADEMMNRNDPTNKRVCVHHDASSKVTPTPTPVS